jgi:hypothetical protein
MDMSKLKIFIASIFFLLISIISKSQSASTGGVFVLGGIHQSHEKAKLYTYKRMDEIYKELNPDILLVETQQKYVSDSSFKGTPYDFIMFMVPSAQMDKTPIFGIDWWDDERGEKWKTMQRTFFNDSTLIAEITLFESMFQALNRFFVCKDFKEINSIYITNLWEAKSEYKYQIMLQHPVYKYIAEFEKERNEHIVDNILEIVNKNPDKKILVAIGIDHKYYIEKKLNEKNIKVYQIDEIDQFKN